MKKWQYAMKRTNSQLKPADLNKYGEQGWELVSVVSSEIYGYIYYFKKELCL